MKSIFPLLLILMSTAVLAPSARADDEADKASSGEKFLETGGKGSTSGPEAIDASGGTGSTDAMNLVNASEKSDGLKMKDVPAPKKGDALGKAIGTAKGAVYGAVAGGVIGGVVGAVGGPAGILGGAAAGAKLGALAGTAVGALAGFLLAGKAGDAKGGVLEQRQQALDDAMRGG